MMDLYGEKRLVILVPNICHLVFTVGFLFFSMPPGIHGGCFVDQ